jgi:hypothetical protein
MKVKKIKFYAEDDEGRLYTKQGLWIRSRIGSGFNNIMDPDWESGSWIRIQDPKIKLDKYFIVNLFHFYNLNVRNTRNY